MLWLVGIVSFGVTRAKQDKDIAENDVGNLQLQGFEVAKAAAGPVQTSRPRM